MFLSLPHLSRQTLAGPVYSNCSWCTAGFNNSPPTGSIAWAVQGCPGIDAQLYHNTHGSGKCLFFPVPGMSSSEFVLAAVAVRGDVLKKKTYQDNVGNYASKNIWSVTWNNKPGNYLFTTMDGVQSVSAPGAVTKNGLYPVDTFP